MVYHVVMAVINLRSVPEDLHHQFKVLCAMRGTNMSALIMELMRQEIAADEAIRGAVSAGVKKSAKKK